MIKTSLIILIVSAVAFIIAFSKTDYNTGRGPKYAKYLGYGSLAGFLFSASLLAYVLGTWLASLV